MLTRQYGPCPHPATVLVADAEHATLKACCPHHAPLPRAIRAGLFVVEEVSGTPPACHGLWISFVPEVPQAPQTPPGAQLFLFA